MVAPSRNGIKSDRHLDTFRAGLKSFVNEARLLARFDHPALVKVYRFWEENGTAYMVMPYYEGRTLKAALAALGRSPGEAELRAAQTIISVRRRNQLRREHPTDDAAVTGRRPPGSNSPGLRPGRRRARVRHARACRCLRPSRRRR
jgi:hypothetical protein